MFMLHACLCVLRKCQHFRSRSCQCELCHTAPEEIRWCLQEVISSLPKEHIAKKVADATFSKLEFKNPSNMVRYRARYSSIRAPLVPLRSSTDTCCAGCVLLSTGCGIAVHCVCADFCPRADSCSKCTMVELLESLKQ